MNTNVNANSTYLIESNSIMREVILLIFVATASTTAMAILTFGLLDIIILLLWCICEFF